MRRYFFHIRQDGKLLPDPEGGEFETSDEARLSAL
jgi:hypothetical protein